MSGGVTMVGSCPVVSHQAATTEAAAQELPDGRIAGSDARTNGSAMSRAGAAPPGSLRRSRSPASRAAADHPAAAAGEP